MASGDTKTEAMLNALGNGGSADEFRGCCNTKTQQYILDAIDRVQNVEDEVEELKNNPDVVDIVDTYADLQAYDTQHLSNNDIIRVLADETHSGNSTYYKFNKQAGTWTFIGEISGGGSTNCRELTSSDYNYPTNNPTTVALWLLDPGVYWWDWNFADGGGISFLSGSGTFPYTNNNLRSYTTQAIVGNSVSGFVTIKCLIRNVNIKDTNFGYSPLFAYSIRVSDGAIVNPSLTSNTIGLGAGDVFGDGTTQKNIQIGADTNAGATGIAIGYLATSGLKNQANSAIAIGNNANTYNGSDGIAIGLNSKAKSNGAIAIGGNSGDATTNLVGSISLGYGAMASQAGEFNIGSNTSTTYGYNNSNYRLLTGLYDGQNANDAVTVGQVNSVIDAINTALSTNIPHIGA